MLFLPSKIINILLVPYNVFAKSSGNYNRHSKRGRNSMENGIKIYNLGIFVKLVSQKC